MKSGLKDKWFNHSWVVGYFTGMNDLLLQKIEMPLGGELGFSLYQSTF